MPDWKNTVNLPRTGFPMKANLQATEPQVHRAMGGTGALPAIRRTVRRARPRFVLHDGPPYANGPHPPRTALNKMLKDFVVKSRTMAGFDAPYVPGWDCHGLPIELKVDSELGGRRSADEHRRVPARVPRSTPSGSSASSARTSSGCGVFGAWDDPYLTMNFPYQAAIVRALGRFVEQGMVYKGKKPVHWCIHCRTALAEAEVEYEPHASPSIYVEFPLDPASARGTGRARAGGSRAGERVGPHLDDDAVDHPVEPRHGVPPGLRVRRSTTSRAGWSWSPRNSPSRWRRRRAGPRRARGPRARAACSRGSSSATRCTTATRSACWPTT